MPESRNYNAEYYDAGSTPADDINFYYNFVSPETNVLELGCGTGRVSIPLSKMVKKLVGVDIAPTMLACAKGKDTEKLIDFIHEDITSISLKQKFDLIIAPFRVLQCFETKEQVSALFDVINNHLVSNGIAILNVFNPYYSKKEMQEKWCTKGEIDYGETRLADGDILRRSCIQKTMDAKNQVLHPELIYRRFRNDKLIDEHINPICMRYYYPDEFKELIEKHNFTLLESWGGYQNQVYGDGPELVVSFKRK